MNKNGEMNGTITIDGKEYEVLTLDRIGEITHAKLAGGKVVAAIYVSDLWLRIESPSELVIGAHEYLSEELPDLGIQPLKLIKRKPVEFTVEVYGWDLNADDPTYFWVRMRTSQCDQHGLKQGMKLKCVQITEEA